MKTMIYVSGALTDVPVDLREDYLIFYERIGELVESMGFVAYVPHLHTDPVRHKDVTPSQVDQIDRRAVTSSSLIIAVADNPSLGVGIEIEMAYHADKPVYLLYHKDRLLRGLVSRLVRGNPSISKEIAYVSQTEALQQLQQSLSDWRSDQGKSVLPEILRS